MFRPITLYYAATAVFLLLDYVLNVNLRVAFLESQPLAKALYYAFCFGCLGLMLWRPAWTNFISAAESLTAVSFLILTMGIRVMVVNDAMLESGRSPISIQELVNFAISGGMGYIAYLEAIKLIKASKKREIDTLW